MRYQLADTLHELMSKDERIFFLTGDLGYKIYDKLLNDFPDRALNIGASEQLMMAMAVGIADSGKIPFVYSITPFLLYRPFEIIRTYINHEKSNVKLIGCGRNDDYSHDGFTHYAGDDKEIMSNFKNIESFWPLDKEDLRDRLHFSVETKSPVYINIVR